MAINSCIENYINGNLKDAKKGAKRYSIAKLTTALESEYCYNNNQSINNDCSIPKK